jgi:hypothetical protein
VSQTVFVLEDDADILRLVQYHLEAAGFTVRPYTTVGTIVTDAYFFWTSWSRAGTGWIFAGACARTRR